MDVPNGAGAAHSSLPEISGNDARAVAQPNGFWKVSSFGRGFKHPAGVAVGPDGAVYVIDSGHGVVKKVEKSGKIVVVIASSELTYYYSLGSISVDGNGDIFLVDNGLVYRFSARGRGLGFPYPYGNADGVAVSYASGSAYVSDYYRNEILRYDPPYVYGDGKIIETASDIRGMSVGRKGDIYVVEDCAVYRMRPGGAKKTRVARKLGCPDAIAAAPDGKFFAIEKEGATVQQISAAGNISTIGSGFDATDLAIDASLNVYLAEPDRNIVVKMTHP
ncbi:MAG TPA: hypothetical protein VJP76_01870 [Candidatus Tumulicola sp.]|nr:hypothetical protein [Candidatus Tumulicola sp.]